MQVPCICPLEIEDFHRRTALKRTVAAEIALMTLDWSILVVTVWYCVTLANQTPSSSL